MSDHDHYYDPKVHPHLFDRAFDQFYRDYLQNVARTVRAEMLEEVQRQWEIAELERMWGEEK